MNAYQSEYSEIFYKLQLEKLYPKILRPSMVNLIKGIRMTFESKYNTKDQVAKLSLLSEPKMKAHLGSSNG